MTTTPFPPITGAPEPVQKTWKPTTAGILNLVAGVAHLIGGIFFMAMGSWFGPMMSMYPIDPRDITGAGVIFAVVGAGILVLGIVSILGGVFALQRRVWGLALAGAICALFIPPFGTILGILAIIFVSMGKKEFT